MRGFVEFVQAFVYYAKKFPYVTRRLFKKFKHIIQRDFGALLVLCRLFRKFTACFTLNARLSH